MYKRQKVDPLKSAATPFTLKFESKQERLSVTGAAKVGTFGTPDIILGGRGTDGVVIDFKTPQNSRFSYTFDEINYAGMSYSSTDSVVAWDPKADSSGRFVYTGGGKLSFASRTVRAVPTSEGFIVEGDINAGGLIISTQGFSLRNTGRFEQFIGSNIPNLSSTIQIEGKAAEVSPIVGRTNHFFNCLLYTSPSPRDRG